MDELPPDGGDGGRFWVRLGVVVGPAPRFLLVDGPAARHRLPEELTVGETLEAPAQAGVHFVHRRHEQLEAGDTTNLPPRGRPPPAFGGFGRFRGLGLKAVSPGL